MSLLLKLLPQFDNVANYSNDILQLEHDEVLFEKIVELEQTEGKVVSVPFKSFLGSEGAFVTFSYGTTQKTAYGDIIKYVDSIQLKLLLKDFEPYHWRNRAVKEFILKLPDGIKVWLYWH
nr:hypothetical protein [uncultured Allomuricauda sp.]